MKSVITKRWYQYFLISFVLLCSYDLINRIINTHYVIEFYLESLMLIFSFITLYAIFIKHHLLAKLASSWSIIVTIRSLISMGCSIYFYYTYLDYANKIGFNNIIYWGVVFLASCFILLGAKKWIKIIDNEKNTSN